MKKNHKAFLKTTKYLSNHYDKLVEKFGHDVRSSQQSSKITRDMRLFHIIKHIDMNKKVSILDFGCGTGYTLEFLKKKRFKGHYTGIDISKQAIILAKKKYSNYKNSRFKILDIFNDSLKKKFDYIIVNGTFNNYTKDNWSWMKTSLTILYAICKKKLIFNNLSIFVDYQDKGLFYIDPSRIIRFTKKYLSKKCIIDHSYHLKKNKIPYEFTSVIIRD